MPNFLRQKVGVAKIGVFSMCVEVMCPFILFCAILLFVITRFANLHLSCDAIPSVHKMLDFKYILDSIISNIILLFMVFIASDAILYPSAKC